MKIEFNLQQKQTLSQKMMQSMEILQMSAQELESYIEALASENPVIDLPDLFASQTTSEKDDLKRKLEWLDSVNHKNKIYFHQNSSEDFQNNFHSSYDSQENLSDFLFSQILLVDYTEEQRAIIEFMILSIDSRGYFTENTSDLAKDFSVSEEYILNLLSDIQSLDPAGIGARDLKECLLLQVKRKKDIHYLTETLIRHHLDDIARNHLHIIAQKLDAPMEEISKACLEIQSLNPKPGNSFGSRENLAYISPDVLIIRLEGSFEILINEYQYPQFTINSYYQNLLHHTEDLEAKQYLQEKIQQAQWISQCIKQRTSTLSKVVHLLVERQQDFFIYGQGNKHPLKLADLAKELDLHESTISRAMRGKYLQCTWGIFPLNYFLTSFASKTSGNKEDLTPEKIKTRIQKIIYEEDKENPFSDQIICDMLKKENMPVSRRTVTKYRAEMNLPDKSGRKCYK